jgi:hypothetical protein
MARGCPVQRCLGTRLQAVPLTYILSYAMSAKRTEVGEGCQASWPASKETKPLSEAAEPVGYLLL